MSFLRNIIILFGLIGFWWVAIAIWLLKFILPEGELLDTVKKFIAYIAEAIRFGGIFLGWFVLLTGISMFFFGAGFSAASGTMVIGAILIGLSRLISKAEPKAKTPYQRQLRQYERVVANPLDHSQEDVESAKKFLADYDARLKDDLELIENAPQAEPEKKLGDDLKGIV